MIDKLLNMIDKCEKLQAYVSEERGCRVQSLIFSETEKAVIIQNHKESIIIIDGEMESTKFNFYDVLQELIKEASQKFC